MASNFASCVYHGKCAGMICCNYLLRTGHMRPCPAGDGCTVKVGYRKRQYPKKRKQEANNG